MARFRSLPVIAVRRMRGNWRLLLSVVIGTVVASAVLSSTAIYADAIRDLGLDFAIAQETPADLDVGVSQSIVGVDRVEYQQSRSRIDGAVAAALGPASAGSVVMGSSATLFPSEPGEPFPAARDRPRAFLRFRTGLEEHVEVVSGVFPRAAPEATGAPIPVAIGVETAERNGIELGRRFDLHPFWNDELVPTSVEVVAIIEAVDPSERYWGDLEEVIDRRTTSWETFAFHVPEATFFGALPQTAVGVQADYNAVYTVGLSALDSRNGSTVARLVGSLQGRLGATEARLRVRTGLVELLERYDEKLFFTRLPLFVLLLQIGGIVAYYLVMVSTMLVERQAAEIALLRSRGATTAQLMMQYGTEGLLLAVLGAATGPPIAAAVISLLGPTPAFAALSGGGLLAVNVSTAAYLLAGGGALLAFASLMMPAWRVTQTTMVQFKRSSARPKPTSLFTRYYLDVALVLISATVFWQLSRQDELFTESLLGSEARADPFVLLTPTVFLLTVGIVFLRLFPLVLRVVAWIIGWTRSVAVLVGMRSLVRNPTHYTRVILLLLFATGVGMFGASFGATLERSYRDRAAYMVGADVRVSGIVGIDAGEGAFRAAVNTVPADVVSPVYRAPGIVQTAAGAIDVEFIGVEPETFRRVAFFRSDFAEQSLDEMLDTLAENGVVATGVPIPADTTEIGMWVKTPDVRGPVTFAVLLRDADGRYEEVTLNANISMRVTGSEVPRNLRNFAVPKPGVDGWRFLTGRLDLRTVRRGGELVTSGRETLVPPLELHAVYLEAASPVARAQGAVLFGPVLATAEPPIAQARLEVTGCTDRPSCQAQAAEEHPDVFLPTAVFPGAVVLHDFATTEGWEVIQGYRAIPVADRATTEVDAPPGFAGATGYVWRDTSDAPPAVRGLRPRTDDEPTVFYLLKAAAQELELEVGGDAVIFVGGTWTAGQLAGVFEFFPTEDVFDTRNDPPAVANLSRLLTVSNSGPARSYAVPTEVWYGDADPIALRSALEEADFEARLVMDVESETLRQQEDPLVAAGWSGILAISFGAVLLLSAIGFLVYSYLTAQRRALEFAILRTLGFSRAQVFSVVAFEQLFTVVAGMGLGTVVGLQVARMMMGFLGTDERGAQVLPPFLLAVSWPSIFLAWGVFGIVFVFAISAVVLLYWRLQIHRALRIGDV